MRLALIGIVSSLCCVTYANAESVDSAYTKLNFENGCVWAKSNSAEEASMGGSAVCAGYSFNGNSWPVYFAEGDIRQFVSFGNIANTNALAGGFSEWNGVNTTIEWRLKNGKPFATILRWFIDTVNPDTGSADKKHQGNVLVISKVAQKNNPYSCVIGYVDARANKDANVMARQVADTHGALFVCGVHEARFFGKRGEYSGTPRELAEDQRRN
ncbi:MAG: hypothetical protein COC17_05385 [Hyphomicrobiales bacterium]|nr:hypothetical protein [Hyphomicrobiales bacterium]PCH50363.1 MAG: hypothetical protein COC17_05385 [Hyphomicrobiales bacterium]